MTRRSDHCYEKDPNLGKCCEANMMERPITLVEESSPKRRSYPRVSGKGCRHAVQSSILVSEPTNERNYPARSKGISRRTIWFSSISNRPKPCSNSIDWQAPSHSFLSFLKNTAWMTGCGPKLHFSACARLLLLLRSYRTPYVRRSSIPIFGTPCTL